MARQHGYQVQHTSFDASAFVKSELSRAGDTVLTDVASNRRRTSVSALSSFMSMTSIPISLTERLNRSCSLSEIASNAAIKWTFV
ncbi:hypothetical protein BSLG_006034 [Batrachochytrium salamandrivorans]|nr:hypothetical protein BSLG_006034 [Batrachochytrium salamandrivorans]